MTGWAGVVLDALLAFVVVALWLIARYVDRLETRVQNLAERVARIEGRDDR